MLCASVQLHSSDVFQSHAYQDVRIPGARPCLELPVQPLHPIRLTRFWRAGSETLDDLTAVVAPKPHCGQGADIYIYIYIYIYTHTYLDSLTTAARVRTQTPWPRSCDPDRRDPN